MNVAMIVLSHYPADPRVRREAEVLANEGVHVDIICLRGKDEPYKDTYHNITAYRVTYGAPKESILNYVILSLKFMISAFLTLFRLDRSAHYDLIQVHNMPDYLVFITLLQKIKGTPVILDLHDLTVELFRTKWTGFKSIFIGPCVQIIEKLSCFYADHLITTSIGFQNKLTARGIPLEKITLILNSADNTIFYFNSDRTFEPKKENVNLIYHGTVAPRFGIETAIHALAAMNSRLPGTTLTVYSVFQPEYLKHLEKLISDNNIEGCVIFADFQPLEKLPEIINKADIGLVPYNSDDFMELALSTKGFEYVASGIPVVASRLFPMTSIFDDDCIQYFKPGDSQDLAEKIISFCSDPELRKSKAYTAYEKYQKISWPTMRDRYLKLINDLVDEKKA